MGREKREREKPWENRRREHGADANQLKMSSLRKRSNAVKRGRVF